MTQNNDFLRVNRKLAAKIGLHEALIVQQIHYWLEKKLNSRDGRYWVYNSYREWLDQFPYMKERNLQDTFRGLEKKGIIIAGNYNKNAYDRTKWYTINYDAPELAEWKKTSPPIYPLNPPTSDENLKAFGKDCRTMQQNLPNGTTGKCQTNTIDYTYTTTENNNNRDTWDFSAPEGAEKPHMQTQKPFDWKILEREIKKSCKNNDINGNLRNAVIVVIKYYYDVYMNTFHKEHPRLTQDKMDEVVLRLVAESDECIYPLDDSLDSISNYRDMINKHFEISYETGGHSICHFVSGEIRTKRYYETCY